MALEKISSVGGTAVYVPGNDIDTDRIIPARFMKCVTFDGLGEYFFYDVRKNADGTDTAHPLNDPRLAGAKVLVTGANFGCGSSREHAPQALYRFGLRAVIAESFAEIFFGNCVTLGIPCVTAAHDDAVALGKLVEQNPALPVVVDVERSRVFYGLDGAQNFPVHIPESAREVLLHGKWDPIADLLEGEATVAATAARLPYMAR
jgi:3-isopropylmalate/(R)-2-methylmalate dehydratase small subunit